MDKVVVVEEAVGVATKLGVENCNGGGVVLGFGSISAEDLVFCVEESGKKTTGSNQKKKLLKSSTKSTGKVPIKRSRKN